MIICCIFLYCINRVDSFRLNHVKTGQMLVTGKDKGTGVHALWMVPDYNLVCSPPPVPTSGVGPLAVEFFFSRNDFQPYFYVRACIQMLLFRLRNCPSLLAARRHAQRQARAHYVGHQSIAGPSGTHEGGVDSLMHAANPDAPSTLAEVLVSAIVTAPFLERKLQAISDIYKLPTVEDLRTQFRLEPDKFRKRMLELRPVYPAIVQTASFLNTHVTSRLPALFEWRLRCLAAEDFQYAKGNSISSVNDLMALNAQTSTDTPDAIFTGRMGELNRALPDLSPSQVVQLGQALGPAAVFFGANYRLSQPKADIARLNTTSSIDMFGVVIKDIGAQIEEPHDGAWFGLSQARGMSGDGWAYLNSCPLNAQLWNMTLENAHVLRPGTDFKSEKALQLNFPRQCYSSLYTSQRCVVRIGKLDVNVLPDGSSATSVVLGVTHWSGTQNQFVEAVQQMMLVVQAETAFLQHTDAGSAYHKWTHSMTSQSLDEAVPLHRTSDSAMTLQGTSCEASPVAHALRQGSGFQKSLTKGGLSWLMQRLAVHCRARPEFQTMFMILSAWNIKSFSFFAAPPQDYDVPLRDTSLRPQVEEYARRVFQFFDDCRGAVYRIMQLSRRPTVCVGESNTFLAFDSTGAPLNAHPRAHAISGQFSYQGHPGLLPGTNPSSVTVSGPRLFTADGEEMLKYDAVGCQCSELQLYSLHCKWHLYLQMRERKSNLAFWEKHGSTTQGQRERDKYNRLVQSLMFNSADDLATFATRRVEVTIELLSETDEFSERSDDTSVSDADTHALIRWQNIILLGIRSCMPHVEFADDGMEQARPSLYDYFGECKSMFQLTALKHQFLNIWLHVILRTNKAKTFRNLNCWDSNRRQRSAASVYTLIRAMLYGYVMVANRRGPDSHRINQHAQNALSAGLALGRGSMFFTVGEGNGVLDMMSPLEASKIVDILNQEHLDRKSTLWGEMEFSQGVDSYFFPVLTGQPLSFAQLQEVQSSFVDVFSPDLRGVAQENAHLDGAGGNQCDEDAKSPSGPDTANLNDEDDSDSDFVPTGCDDSSVEGDPDYDCINFLNDIGPLYVANTKDIDESISPDLMASQQNEALPRLKLSEKLLQGAGHPILPVLVSVPDKVVVVPAPFPEPVHASQLKSGDALLAHMRASAESIRSAKTPVITVKSALTGTGLHHVWHTRVCKSCDCALRCHG